MRMDLSVKKKYTAALGDVDFLKKMKLSALFNAFQDIGSIAAESLGYGYSVMEAHSIAWVLIRIRVDVIRYPDWNEEIEIETWPQETRKVEFERDFLVRDSSGDIIVRGVSSWVTLSLEERKIKKCDFINLVYPDPPKEKAISCMLGKFKAQKEPIGVYEKVVGYSDADMNGHLNNAKYIDFIMDCFPFETHRQHEVSSIEVNYLNEALPGEVITLRKDISGEQDSVIYVEGVNSAGKVYFKTRLEIRPRS